MNPNIKLDIDPHRVLGLGMGQSVVAGGVRVKTTIYVVEEPDIVGATTSSVTVFSVEKNQKVELRIVE